MYQSKRHLKQRVEDLQEQVKRLEQENFALCNNPLLSWYGKELCLVLGGLIVSPRYMQLDYDQFRLYIRDVLDYMKEIRLLEESYQRENQADGGDGDGKQEAQAT